MDHAITLDLPGRRRSVRHVGRQVRLLEGRGIALDVPHGRPA